MSISGHGVAAAMDGESAMEIAWELLDASESDALTGGDAPRDDGLAAGDSIVRFFGCIAGPSDIIFLVLASTVTMRFWITGAGLFAKEAAEETED